MSLIAAMVVVVLAVVAVAYQVWPDAPAMSARSYYTTDNGKTFFRDSLYKAPPYDKGGTTAVRALVFRSQGGEFVGILHRYNAATQKLVNDALIEMAAGTKQLADVDALIGSDRVRGGTEAALPGANPKWVSTYAISPRDVKSPDGTPAVFVSP